MEWINVLICQKKVLITTTVLWIIVIMIYYNVFTTFISTPKQLSNFYSTTRATIPHYTGSDDENFLLNNTGCSIPNYSKTLKFKKSKHAKITCPARAVFVQKITEEEIRFKIDVQTYQKKFKEKIHLKCTYQFASPGKDDTKLSYTNPKPFDNGTTVRLEEEFLVTTCKVIISNGSIISPINDAYLILKKKPTYDKKVQSKENVTLKQWNILIVGMDTMSRARAYQTIPKTVNFIKTQGWLDYRGYNKVGLNTFPNLMALLSGKNSSSAYAACGKGMEACRNSLIWKYFNENGYLTAFGEENLQLPDTFSPYKGFKKPPTDHYARPFYLAGEIYYGKTLCTGNKPSSVHLLEYALQFAQAYKNDAFFGLFWSNSYSHNPENIPALFENSLIEFFTSLNKSNILDRTFVLFLSDHGIRYGEMRIPKESFYEERLPMFFMWVPYLFRETHPYEYYNMQRNQYRLTSTYDLHATLWELMKLSNKDIYVIPPEACPQCTSFTKEIQEERTCGEAHIDEKWCTCHDMTDAKDDPAGKRSVEVVAEYVRNKSISIKTKKCTICSALEFKNVIRNYRYINGMKTYYIVAIRFSPADVAVEGTVEHYDNNYKIMHPTDTITPYHSQGYCSTQKNIRHYCVCKKIPKCH